MADLLGDGTGFNQEDPAAEFLAREQSELAELGIDDQIGVEQITSDIDSFGIQEPQQPQPLVNGFSEDVTESTFGQMSSGIAQPIQTQEPESLKKWREEKAELLSEMENEEREEQQKWNDKAKKDLDDWYSRYNEQLQKVKNENRAAQEEFIEEMTSTKPGNEWEKVSRLCDFNPKNSKNTKDVSRMRSILLHLKQEPLVR